MIEYITTCDKITKLTPFSMRFSILFSVILLGIMVQSCAQSTIPDKDNQIGAALLAAPEEHRADATVLGYDSDGKVVTLREGSNSFICLADDPNRAGFNVACYHKDLEPFMARGRALRAEGKSGGEVFEMREQEAKDGKLKMPEEATTLYVFSGKDAVYDPETGEAAGANLRYVVYIPWATPESSGLPVKEQVPGGPWIMFPGTHAAHIMITPPPKK